MLFAKIYSGMNLWALGDFAHAEQELRATLVAGTEFGRVSARRTAYLIEVLLDSGQTDAAHSMAQDMLAAARQRNRTWDEGNMLWALADVHARRGELLLAEQAVVRSCELLQASPILEVAAKGLRAAIVLRAGRTSEALSLAEQTMQQYMAMPGFGWRLAQARLTYVRCLLATGQQDLAREQLAGALAALDRRAQLIVDAALQQSFRRRVVEHAETLALATELGLPGP
jgi:tetratricopeptide (TPR) repeat protein